MSLFKGSSSNSKQFQVPYIECALYGTGSDIQHILSHLTQTINLCDLISAILTFQFPPLEITIFSPHISIVFQTTLIQSFPKPLCSTWIIYSCSLAHLSMQLPIPVKINLTKQLPALPPYPSCWNPSSYLVFWNVSGPQSKNFYL